MKFFLQYKYHFFLVLIGLSLLTVVNGLLHFDKQNIIYADSESYLATAKNLYQNLSGQNYRPMLIAVIHGIPYLFSNSDALVFEFSFYLNLLCWLATGLVLFEILRNFLSGKMAFLFALCSYLFIGTLAFIYHLMTENSYLLFIVVAFYFLQKYYKTKSFWTLSITLSILILSMLVRPGSKWLAVLFLLFYLKEVIRFYKTKAALLIYGSLFLVLVQCAGIKYQFGNFTISYIDSVTYYNYIGSKALAYKNNQPYNLATDPRTYYIFSLKPPQIQETAQKDLMNQLQHNSANLLRAYGDNLYGNVVSGNIPLADCKNVAKTNYFPFWKSAFFGITQWQNRIFTLLGFGLALFFLFRGYRKQPYFALIGVYIGYIIGTAGISCDQGDRFHLVVFPFVLILLARWLYDRKMIA